jgi:uncharacterized protein
MYLPDINLWIAWAFDMHVHHGPATTWFEERPEASFFFCRLTQQGFLRLASNPRVLKEDAVSLAEAWRLYDTILSDPRISFLDEPTDVEVVWRSYTQGLSFAPNTWSDAFLAAVARAAHLELVTFDRGFRKFRDLSCTILS